MMAPLPMSEHGFTHTILLVDDEPGIVRLCRRLLEKGGFRVIGVTDPREGITSLEREHVDLLLVDIRMPVMDGFTLIERARTRQPELAVVVMTGYGTVETAVEALRRGADGLVLKPFAGRELVDSVQSALRDSQQKQDAVRLQTLRPLFAITEALFAETHPERLQSLLLDTILGHLHCSRVGLYFRESGQADYHVQGWVGEPLARHDFPSFHEMLERAESWKLPVSLGLESGGSEEDQSFFRTNHLGSLLAAPIFAPRALSKGGHVLLAVRDLGEPNFRQSDLEILAILARQAAAAMENARLHADLRAYIRQVEDSQRALIQAEKMAIAGRMTASIAHEINNPLQAVQNCLHLAGRPELTPEERHNYQHLAQTELERLMQTVHQMLDYYRPGGLDRKRVDLNDIVQRVLLLMDRQLVERNINYRVQYTSNLPEVLVVGDQLQQVLLNLVINAMEAMPDGGDLCIETYPRSDGVEILVEDSGPGIPPDQRERIFEPFVSTKESGTGLGLAVSYGIISAHGGSLDLLDGRGPGACFRIRLPIGDSA
jgi:two-component system, NtrC family, sensor kinase